VNRGLAMRNGCFITFEGSDGCGKSTQAKLLAEYLTSMDYEVVLTREPGGTPLAENIRQVILTPTAETLHPMTEILLYAASRAQHVEELIKPALAAGKVVICDRFIDSSLAYQGYGLGRDLQMVSEINLAAVGAVLPDLTIVIDITVEEALERAISRSGQIQDRIESRDLQFHQRVRQGFLELAKDNPRMKVLEASGKSIEQIHSEVINQVQPVISSNKANF